MNKIKLNFLPLEEPEFFFTVFRKKILGSVEKKEGIKNYRLYADDDSNERDNYEVSLIQQNDYEEFVIHSNHCISLTKWYLFEEIKKSIESCDDNINYTEYKKGKILELNFVYCSYPEGDQIITLLPYFLSSEKLYGFLIDFKFHKNENQPFNKRVQQLSLSLDQNFRSNKNFYLNKNEIFNEFLNNVFSKFNFINKGSEQLSISQNLIELNSFSLEKKNYIFSKNKSSFSQFMGIKNFGPFEYVSHDINFVFIFEKRFTPFANELFLSLIGKTNPGTFPGLERMFGISLNKNNVQKIIIEDYKDTTLLETINHVKDISRDKKVLAIFIEDYFEEEGNSQPYYFMKYHFVRNDIPLQVVNYNRLSQNNNLKWSTSNLGLQIFSKLGGKPWIVNPSKKNCLILGIGSSHKIDHESNCIKKYFAYSVCLDSSGLYKKLEVLSESDNEEDYLKNLEFSLLNMLNTPEFSSYKNCVLHLPFKIKNKEIDSLQNVIRDKSDMEFKVVKINVKNNFFGFSDHNTLVPYESTYISLNNDEFLVWFEGLQYGKENVAKQISSPVHIKFLNMDDKKFREDYKPYLQDIINLSGANWRGFNAKSVPISIFYSKLITQYISEFGDIFDSDNKTISNEKPWFL